MTAQKLDRVLKCYRIGDPDGVYPIFDAEGSKREPGRWNTETSPLIYTSEHYSTAMLEKLANGNGNIPSNQYYIEITLPNGLSYEMVTKDSLPDWANEDMISARNYGANWHKEKRSAILIVPSFVARMENNILINPEHAGFIKITPSLPAPIWWDTRIYKN